MAELAVVVAVSDAERARVRAASPLAAELLLQCGPALLPIGVAACSADTEQRDGDAGDALRAALAEDPWAGMGSLETTGWLLAAASSTDLVFVHRVGEVGVGQVLVLHRTAGRWRPVALSGAALRVPGGERTGARIETVLSARPCAGGVELEWVGDGDLDGVQERRVDEVRISPGPEAVHVLVITVPVVAPGSGGSEGELVWTAGVGVRMRAVADLASPLGSRTLLDDSRVPASPVKAQTDPW